MVYSNTTRYSTQHTSQQKQQKDNKTPKQPPRNNTHNFSNNWTALAQLLAQPRLPGYDCQGILCDHHHIQQLYEDVSNTTAHLQ